MVPVESVFIVCHISWFGVCPNQLLFVLASNVNVVDGQLFYARRQKINVVMKHCISVIIVTPSKWVSVTIELCWEIQLSIFHSSTLVHFDVIKVGW